MSNRAERRRAAKEAKRKVSLDEAIRLAKQEAGRVLRQGQAEQESRDLEVFNVLWWSAIWVLHNDYGWCAKRLNAFQVHWAKLIHIMSDLTRDKNREDRVTPESIIDQLMDECRDKLLPISEIERLAGIRKIKSSPWDGHPAGSKQITTTEIVTPISEKDKSVKSC